MTTWTWSSTRPSARSWTWARTILSTNTALGRGLDVEQPWGEGLGLLVEEKLNMTCQHALADQKDNCVLAASKEAQPADLGRWSCLPTRPPWDLTQSAAPCSGAPTTDLCESRGTQQNDQKRIEPSLLCRQTERAEAVQHGKSALALQQCCSTWRETTGNMEGDNLQEHAVKRQNKMFLNWVRAGLD